MSDSIVSDIKNEAGLLEALRVVVDPEINMNVVELGLIRQVELGDERTHITMIMTTPFCPYAPQLLEQVRRTAQEYTRLPTTIEMGLEMWDPSMMEDGAADDWGLF
jgi:metal-sulfur cluster biosynthetic enzyme